MSEPATPASLPIDSPPAPAPPFRRIPHLGDALLLALLYLAGLACAVIAIALASYFHLFGVSSVAEAGHSIVYALGSTAISYVVAFGAGALIFPLLWRRPILAALQWNQAAAARYWWRLLIVGVASVALNVGLSRLLHLPAKSPMSDLLTTPQAWWATFAFSVSIAPLAEEIIFRGFLLPALATSWDWTQEKLTRRPPRPLGPNGHPQWSLAAMIFGALVSSAVFGLGHAAQDGWAWSPLLLITLGGLILASVRLATRSLAASTLTHAAYNLTLFTLTLVRTHGFHTLHH